MNKTQKVLVSTLLVMPVLAITLSVETNAGFTRVSANECDHVGNHYLANDPTCNSSGNKEFYACCKCLKQFLFNPGGSFVNRGKYNGVLNSSHVAYLPKTNEHAGFDENGLCVNGCGTSIASTYNMVSSTAAIPGQSLSDIGLDYKSYTSIPLDSSGHTFGTYDFKTKGGIDLYFDYSYTYNGTDSWFYIYLFNQVDESGPVIRVNTNNPDGDVRGFIYTKSNYAGDFVVNPSETANKFHCQIPTNGTNTYMRVKADLVNSADNTFNISLFFGINGGVEKQATINGNPVNMSITLGADYFTSGHNRIRFSNHNSNIQIKEHHLNGPFIKYNTEGGSFIGALPIENEIVLPTLQKEGYEFLGWYLSNGYIVTQGSEFSVDTDVYPKFVQYTELVSDQEITLSPNETRVITINKSLANDNYLSLDYSSTNNLKGKFTMSGTTTSFEEDFYLDKNETTFNTFLDTFRKSGRKQQTTTLNTISLTNFNTTSVTFKLGTLKRAPRNYLIDDVLYLKDDTVRLGISMKLGGAISSLQNIISNLVEYITSSHEVKIREKSKITESIYKEITRDPNLINIFDLGREVQQSYYYNVDSNNGYTRSTYNGSLARYNPVQSGDSNFNESKIIDFRQDKDSIYVKVQAQDWAKNNSLSKSYMTNTYSLKNGLVYVNNTFINWYGFTNYDVPTTGDFPANTPYVSTQELPAIYVVHPLSYFSTVYSTKEIFDDKSGWNLGTSKVESASQATIDSFVQNSDGTYKASNDDYSYHYEFRVHPKNYLGYFNEDKFGVGVYMNAGNFFHDSGNRHIFMNGNYYSSHNTTNKNNRTYRPNLTSSTTLTETSFLRSPIESCYINNCNYLTTILGLIPSEYTKLDWSYAIGVDQLEVLKDKFATIKTNGELYNDFTNMAGANI